MKIHQLSVFLENKPGQLRAACAEAARAGINIVTLSLADTEQFGILRLIIQDWQKAKAIFEKAGFVVKDTEVLAIEVADEPGGLLRILEIVDQAGLNIEYMYAFTERRGGKAALVFRFEDPDAAQQVLKAAGVNVLRDLELFRRA
ncbi:MAG TPA: ACT domain-containing protein [Verrucomicrobiae bacterium]|nr:ACT domain-containing protein [Verrucomicrobiae bacterium]